MRDDLVEKENDCANVCTDTNIRGMRKTEK